MGRLPSYTLSDLVSRSGFDKRTIAYYISEGLLPKVGRRGRNTTYPQEFMERLMFIRRVRDMQDDGQLRAVTLAEIRSIMQELSADEIRQAVNSSGPIEWVRERFTDPDWDTSELAVSAEQVALSMFEEPEQQSWDAMEDEQAMFSGGEPVTAKEPTAKSSRMAPASQRRDSMKKQTRPLRSMEIPSVSMEDRDLHMGISRAKRERKMDDLMDSISRIEGHMEKMNASLREEMRYELRDMKDLVLGLHKRLKYVEDHIKPDSDTGKDDSDSNEG